LCRERFDDTAPTNRKLLKRGKKPARLWLNAGGRAYEKAGGEISKGNPKRGERTRMSE